MTGKVRLYSKTGCMMRSLFFHSKEEVKKILERWRDFYGDKMQDGWIQVAPYVSETRVINMKSTEFINRERMVINRTKANIEIEDFKEFGLFKHETWFHKVYYKGEK